MWTTTVRSKRRADGGSVIHRSDARTALAPSLTAKGRHGFGYAKWWKGVRIGVVGEKTGRRR